MSQSLPKRSSAGHPNDGEDRSGRFAIDDSVRGLGTVLPPPGDEAELVSLEDVGAIMEAEAEPGTGRAPEPSLPRGMVSGVFSARPQASAPPPVPADVHARREPIRDGERAQIEIEDLSLRPGNPYAASSLVPPPRKPPNAGKLLAVAGAVAALAAAGWGLLHVVTAEPRTAARMPAAAARPERSTAQPVRESTAPSLAANEASASPAPRRAEPASRPVSKSAALPVASPAPAENSAPPVQLIETAAEKAALAPKTQTAVAESEAPAEEAPAPVSAEEAAAALAALPQTPSREQVIAGFETVQAALAQCAAGKHGVAQIEATIASSGRISHALIGGDFQGSAEGSCMARVVRAASFPQFRQSMLKVSYPVAL